MLLSGLPCKPSSPCAPDLACHSSSASSELTDWHFSRFDGDGMLHACRIKDGKVTYCNRYLETFKLAQEAAVGFPTFSKVLPHMSGLASLASAQNVHHACRCCGKSFQPHGNLYNDTTQAGTYAGE